MEHVQLNVSARDTNAKAKTLRKQGYVPAVIYNHGSTQHIQIHAKDIKHVFAHGVSESVLYDLKDGDKSDTAFIKDYHIHPISEDVLHLDFYRVTYGEKIRTNIPIHLEGKPKGVKEGGVLESFLHELEVEILPKDLVPAIEVNVDDLEIGDAIHVSNLQLPGGARLLHEHEEDPIVCHVSMTAKMKGEDEEEGEEESALPASDSEEGA